MTRQCYNVSLLGALEHFPELFFFIKLYVIIMTASVRPTFFSSYDKNWNFFFEITVQFLKEQQNETKQNKQKPHNTIMM